MHEFVTDAVVKQLASLGKDPSSSDVLVCGLAFKGRPETGDYRNSPGVEIARHLQRRVGRVFGHDPVVSAEAVSEAGFLPAVMPEGVRGKDAVLVLTNHPTYEKMDVFTVARSLRAPGIVYDGWHMFRAEDVLSVGPCVYMGLGYSASSVGR
jgi:UDP-N-acetyl-D-mannosaminuronate dehydrogenase